MEYDRVAENGYTFNMKTFNEFDKWQTILSENTTPENFIVSNVMLIDYICNPAICLKSQYIAQIQTANFDLKLSKNDFVKLKIRI